MPTESAARRQSADDCSFCAEMKAAGTTFFPPHDASSWCESGKHNHCTCDACF